MEEVIKEKISGTAEPQGKKRKQDTFLRDATESLAVRYTGSSKSFRGTSQHKMTLLGCLSQHKSHEEYLCKSSKSSSDRFGALHLGMTPNGTKGWHGGKKRILLLQIRRHCAKISEMSNKRNKTSDC